MSLLRRVPGEARALVLADERVLAWAETSAGWVVATPTHFVTADGQRVAWESVQRATWDEGVLLLRRPGEPDVRLSLALKETALPEVVRERVEASIVLTEKVALSLGDAVIMARRPPSGGDISWTVVFEGGDEDDPAMQAEASAEVERLRALLP